MHLARISVENFRMFGEAERGGVLAFNKGLTALIGENDAGKTAFVDALRLALGTTDQEWPVLEDDDFNGEQRTKRIRIACKFESLTPEDQSTFLEFLTYDQNDPPEPVLYVTWTAEDTGLIRRGRPYRRLELRSGREGDGPVLPLDVRDLLRVTYMRPLRDAARMLSSGRSSRLSQVLRQTKAVRQSGRPYDPDHPIDPATLSVVGIGDYANDLLRLHVGIGNVRRDVDSYLDSLMLEGEEARTAINVGDSQASDEARLRSLLEKLDLQLRSEGRAGLGSENLLFLACELLLLVQEGVGVKVLVIEEPEAHLDTQRQLQLVGFLQKLAESHDVQLVITTHSPNLASVIKLDNVVMIRGGRTFALSRGHTRLEPSDYRFLERFLDVTKANLFFARGVLIVEGDAENILVPTLAALMGLDFTKHGVSVVNVGSVGLRRYARIFQRSDPEGGAGEMQLPIACVTDMDVMPGCGARITSLGLSSAPELGAAGLATRRHHLEEKATGQSVRTFVADHWTLEYDLSVGGLAEDVFVAARLAKRDSALDEQALEDEVQAAKAAFVGLADKARVDHFTWASATSTEAEVLACHVYAEYLGKVSKPAAAQFLSNLLCQRVQSGELTAEGLRAMVPPYLVAAIEYVASGTGGVAGEGTEASVTADAVPTT